MQLIIYLYVLIAFIINIFDIMIIFLTLHIYILCILLFPFRQNAIKSVSARCKQIIQQNNRLNISCIWIFYQPIRCDQSRIHCIFCPCHLDQIMHTQPQNVTRHHAILYLTALSFWRSTSIKSPYILLNFIIFITLSIVYLALREKINST